MALSNFDRVGRSLETLKTGLWPFVNREFEAAWGATWPQTLLERMPTDLAERARKNKSFDIAGMLSSMFVHWNEVFSKTLGNAERSIVAELRDARNKWAHQETFSTDDTYRVLDSMERLLRAVSSPEAAQIETEKQTVLRIKFEEQARFQSRKASTSSVEGTPTAGLLPWRELITPHPDVASGSFQQAEFAADLNSVHRGRALPEYGDPRQFFARTFLTEGLQSLLVGAVKRLANTGGDPVVQLRTNFGGGKTHSMLALYHLVSGAPASEMVGVETVLERAGVSKLPSVNRAVLVGTALAPAQTRVKDDGTEVATMWGEIAYQLLGPRGYDIVAGSDKAGTSPGKELLEDVFRAAAPCLILIDEWVAVLRQLKGKTGLPAGSFEANVSFAQSLTEAAKAVPGVVVVVSLPESEIELGGDNGKEALQQLSNVVERITSGWKTATTEEGFEIVRRRLFQPMETAKYAQRDAVLKKFAEMYVAQSAEFPPECREASYEARLKAAYPFHPELFDRLYSDWCSLEKFQRTRGVLRLMAAAIHALWRDGDKGLLIMPSTMPLGEGNITSELTRYLDEPWLPVIEKDVDGEGALPKIIDGANPNLGRYSATRRVARTLFMGSAPTLHAANKGLDERRVKLGCVQPGESVPTFGDALRRLTDAATHLYVDGQRFWFSTQPSVNRLAQDRMAQLDSEDVWAELTLWLRRECSQRGLWSGVHVAPGSHAEVPDERDVRLVVLGPTLCHSARSDNSPARTSCAQMLDKRGSSPRRFKNTLAFLAPDATRLGDLETATRQFIAWKGIEDEAKTLNLDEWGRKQAETKRAAAENAIRARIPETWVWLLAPSQDDPRDAQIEWAEFRLGGNEPLAVRAAKKLVAEGALTERLGGTVLRSELDRIPLWRDVFADGNKDAVSLRQLIEDFALYLYLPRITGKSVVLEAAREGVRNPNWTSETFAYSSSLDEAKGRFLGLSHGELPTLEDGFLVSPVAAIRQIEADEAARLALEPPPAPVFVPDDATNEVGPSSIFPPKPVIVPPVPPVEPARPKRFFGSVELNATRASRDVDNLVKEVLGHLTGLDGADVRVTLEIEAEVPGGVPDRVQMIVSENCRNLKFKQQSFESD